jgi:hypothetical protein
VADVFQELLFEKGGESRGALGIAGRAEIPDFAGHTK